MRNTSNRIVLTTLAASLLLGPGIGVSCAQPVIVERAMPAPIVEAVPPAPASGSRGFQAIGSGVRALGFG
jgi:hypothetical protein